MLRKHGWKFGRINCRKMNSTCGELFGNLNSTMEKVLYTIINITVFIAASVLNITIIVLVKKRPVLHKPSFILLTALACSDLAMVCLTGTLYLAITLSDLSNNDTVKIATCYIISSITVNNLLLLCCITHDRYQAIKHSMDSRPYTTKRRAAVKIAFCIFTSMSFSTTFVIETIHDFWVTTLELLFAVMLGCFLYIIIIYFKLFRVVRLNRMDNLPLGPRESNESSIQRHHSCQSNLNKSISLLIASYIFAFFPVSIIAILRNVLYRLNAPPNKLIVSSTVWCTTFSLSNSLMDPLIYTYRSDAIGRELRWVMLL